MHLPILDILCKNVRQNCRTLIKTRFGKIHDCEQVICNNSIYFYIILYISIHFYIFLYTRKLAAFGGLCLQFEGGGQTNRQTERQEFGQTNTQKDRHTNSPLYYIYSFIIVYIFIYFYICLYISIYFYIFIYIFIYLYIFIHI